MKQAAMRAQLRSMGWPVLAGLVALALAGAALLQAQSWDLQTQRLEAETTTLRSQLQAQRAAAAMPVVATPKQWIAGLPATPARQQRLADLLELGMRNGLVGLRTEHRLSVDITTGLERLRVHMPATGQYAQLRSFIEAALQQDPALSLDSLKVRRPSAQAADLDIEMVWSLHARTDSGGPQP